MAIEIGNVPISPGHRPFIIAEMSGNHNQSLDRALEIVDAAASAGAHALKLQTYTADTITLDVREGEFFIADDATPWQGRSLYELYQAAHTPWEWHEPIMQRAAERGMVCFSSPFDHSAVDFLEELQVPAYKIASFENADIPLIRRVAATGKPVIVSTGMATLAELDEAVRTLRDGGCEQLVLLKCTSTYPATPGDSNILTIPHMRRLFDCEIGLSDHTMGLGAAVAAVAHGATVVEKHLTLSRGDGGVDSTFSLEPAELARLVTETERAWQSLGTVAYGPTEAEMPSLRFRRSLYVTRDMKAGEVFTVDNVRSVRPANGLPPRCLDQVLGRKVSRDVKKGTALSWELVA